MKKIGDVTSTADKNSEWTNGNVAAGIAPTIIESGWLNSVQREILNVLLKADIPQNKDKDNQLAEAIGKIISNGKFASQESVDGKLAKDQNGADIQDKSKFIKNLGLGAAAKSGLVQGHGTSESDVMSQKGVTENDIPVGTVIFVSHNKSVAGRFLKAVGPAVSRTLYADLFAVIGTTYGAGDGSTTFNLPDTRDEFPRFAGDSRNVGSKQGDATRNFTGTVSARTATNSARIFSKDTAGVFTSSGADGAMLENGTATSPLPADRLTTLNIDGSRQLPTADEIRPRNIAFAGWIKY